MSTNNPNFTNRVPLIYSKELGIRDKQLPLSHLFLICTRSYDKTEGFNFIITHFLYCDSNTVKVFLFVNTIFRGSYKNALSHGFLKSWFQTIQATINGTIVIRWILIFVA